MSERVRDRERKVGMDKEREGVNEGARKGVRD